MGRGGKGARLRLRFNASLLRDERVVVQAYPRPETRSLLQVLEVALAAARQQMGPEAASPSPTQRRSHQPPTPVQRRAGLWQSKGTRSQVGRRPGRR